MLIFFCIYCKIIAVRRLLFMKNYYKLTLAYYKWLFDDNNTKLNPLLDLSIAEKEDLILPMIYYPEQYSELLNSEIFTRLKRITQTRHKISFCFK